MNSSAQRILSLAEQVVKLYSDLEKDQSALSLCPSGCRNCCDTPAKNIEATILEFLPLAIQIISYQYKYLELLEKLEKVDEEDRCVLFEPNVAVKPEGGCSIHRYRPLVCRLFGASCVVRKNQRQPLACHVLHQSLGEQLHLLPDAQQYNTRLIAIDFFLSQERYDINTALRKALQYVGLYLEPSYPHSDRRSA